MKNKTDAAKIEREIGHNTAVALAQQITKLEDQLDAERAKREDWEKGYGRLCNKAAVLVDALKDIASTSGTSISKRAKAQAALEKISPQDKPVQLPMINDDPVVSLK